MPSTITGLPLSGPEALTVFGAITLVLARWLPDRFRGPATLAAGALLVGSVTVLVVGGLRWQLVPVVAAAAVAAPFALVPMVRRRTGRTPWRARWWLALPGSAVCAALIASGPVSAWALPVPEFPEPSGRFPVGTQVLEFSTRPEGDGRDEESRTLVTQLWYPAGRSAPDAPRMPYLGRTEAESRTVSSALAGYAGVPGFLLDGLPRARSHAVPGAPAAREGGRLPVVLFSPDWAECVRRTPPGRRNWRATAMWWRRSTTRTTPLPWSSRTAGRCVRGSRRPATGRRTRHGRKAGHAPAPRTYVPCSTG